MAKGARMTPLSGNSAGLNGHGPAEPSYMKETRQGTPGRPSLEIVVQPCLNIAAHKRTDVHRLSGQVEKGYPAQDAPTKLAAASCAIAG